MSLSSRYPLSYYLARKPSSTSEKTPRVSSYSLPSLLAGANITSKKVKEVSDKALLDEVALQKLEYAKLGQPWQPLPYGPLRHLLKNVKKIYLSGGGGAGRAYPGAFAEAAEFGLDLNKVTEVNATSVGTIQGLMVILGYSAKEMKERLLKMPTAEFQDWDIRSIFTFFKRWGLCRGEAMGNYFKNIIREKTGLEDPTFKELYDAGYSKEFRVITTNVSRREMAVFSYKNTPNVKVAWTLNVACSLPGIFPPGKLCNDEGEEELFSDGGFVSNYPWRILSDPEGPLDEQLGFMFMNAPEALSLKNSHGKYILNSIWHYFYSLIWIVLFHNPISLSEDVRQRTVKIRVKGQNPLDFTANSERQDKLDEAGKQGVREFIRDWLEMKERRVIHEAKEKLKGTSFSAVPSCIKAYYLFRHLVNAPAEKQVVQSSQSPVITNSRVGS